MTRADLAREVESFQRDTSKYEQQSSDIISNAIKHGIVCGGNDTSGAEAKQHIDLSISLLSTSSGLARRDHQLQRRRERTWTDPNAMQLDAVHLGGSVQHHPSGRGQWPACIGPEGRQRQGEGRQEGQE